MTAVESFVCVGFPEMLIQCYKAAEPFYFLEYGQNALPVAREYVTIPDGQYRYEGEVDQAGNKCGKGIYFKENEFYYFIAEGLWLDGKINGLGRIFTCLKGSQELNFYFGKHQASMGNGIGSFNAIDRFIYTGYFKDGKPNGIGLIDSPFDQSSYFGEWKDAKREGVGIETRPDGTRVKGLFAENEFIKTVDLNEALLD